MMEHYTNILPMATRKPNMSSNRVQRDKPFKRMTDVEIVLRLFAFKEPELIVGSVRTTLDNAMMRYRNADIVVLDGLKNEFRSAIDLCAQVFGPNAFRIPAGEPGRRGRLSRPYFDAQMVVMYQLWGQRDLVLMHSRDIEAGVRRLAEPESPTYELLVGRANTAVAVRERIEAVRAVIRDII